MHEVLAGKWSGAIIAALAAGPLRYNRLLERVEGISPRMLTLTLRSLEDAGLVERRQQGAALPYELSVAGRELLPVLDALEGWARRTQWRRAEPFG
jgi:DNA-binding HxlR family transcriptional regulator